MDYAGNSNKEKDKKNKPEKKIEKVVTGEVIIHKKPLGQKIHDLFIGATMKSVGTYVFSEVLVPAFKDMLFNAVNKGGERLVYGESTYRRGYGPREPRMTYNSPINRGYRESEKRYSDRPSQAVSLRNDYVLASRDEAEGILEQMSTIIDSYDVVSVADLKEMMGLVRSYVDDSWGWTSIIEANVRQIREGYLLDLPKPEPIQQ